jgi:hypothetical protein
LTIFPEFQIETPCEPSESQAVIEAASLHALTVYDPASTRVWTERTAATTKDARLIDFILLL